MVNYCSTRTYIIQKGDQTNTKRTYFGSGRTMIRITDVLYVLGYYCGVGLVWWQ
jgi:hypothetical protein